jgi:predicted RNase H-like nuclease (RuvC/YqgF family)
MGEIRCPYCNSASKESEYIEWNQKKTKYKIITAYCRRKNADKNILKKVTTIRDLESKINEIKKEIQKIQSETGEYKVLQKKIRTLSNKKYDLRRKIRDKKNELIYNVNIIPFFIHKK